MKRYVVKSLGKIVFETDDLQEALRRQRATHHIVIDRKLEKKKNLKNFYQGGRKIDRPAGYA